MWANWNDVDNSFAALDNFQHQLTEFFRGYEPRRRKVGLSARTWPPANLYDAGEHLVVRAEAPGLGPKEFNITATEDSITISGQPKPNVPERYASHRQERLRPRFSRTFALPCAVDTEKTRATARDGILTVTMAKTANARPRQISVKAG